MRMPSISITSTNDSSLEQVADCLAQSSRILLFTGAGISTNLGIPDFRSKTGLNKKTVYDAIVELCNRHILSDNAASILRVLPKSVHTFKVTDLFHASQVYTSTDAIIAFNLLCVLLRRAAQACTLSRDCTQNFARDLRDSGRLLRYYTQNIDGLEQQATLKTNIQNDSAGSSGVAHVQLTKVSTEAVPLHGELLSLRCQVCTSVFPWLEEHDELFLTGHEPKCSHCRAYANERAVAKKRAPNIGSLRPNIVLYQEQHPQDHIIATFIHHDIHSRPEVLLIMGTSLATDGARKLVKDLARAVHQHPQGYVICVNQSSKILKGNSDMVDYFIQMDCDAWVKDVRQRRRDILKPFQERKASHLLGHLKGMQRLSQQEQDRQDEIWLQSFF